LRSFNEQAYGFQIVHDYSAIFENPSKTSQIKIAQIVNDFRQAARRAINAGFDGVEVHGANGYLIDQFLRTTSNTRTDEYSGSRSNRLRFLREVIDAISDEIGAERTAIRLAPFLTARGMDCPDILPTILEAAQYLQEKGIGYLHLVEADWERPGLQRLSRRRHRASLRRATRQRTPVRCYSTASATP